MTFWVNSLFRETWKIGYTRKSPRYPEILEPARFPTKPTCWALPMRKKKHSMHSTDSKVGQITGIMSFPFSQTVLFWPFCLFLWIWFTVYTLCGFWTPKPKAASGHFPISANIFLQITSMLSSSFCPCPCLCLSLSFAWLTSQFSFWCRFLPLHILTTTHKITQESLCRLL